MAETTRRNVLIAIPSLTALSACGADPEDSATNADTATPTRDPEPDPWIPDGDADEDAFPYGVQVGDASASGAVVSVHSTEETLTMVVVMADGADAWVEVDRREGLAGTDGVFQITLTDLTADTAWSVAFFASDGARRSAPARFRTALAAGDQRVVTFGATSCLGGNLPWQTLSRAAEDRLDFFAFLGDTVYADGSTAYGEFASFWDAALRVQGMRDLSASTSTIATWDDHEVDNNWSWDQDGIEERFANATQAFNDFMPHVQGGGRAGIWRKISWGDTLDVFVLECRAERVPEDGIYISAEQMSWLKDGLAQSTARFKIILNSVPISAFLELFSVIQIEDRWEGYPEAREEIISFINDNDIEGVLWVAGDFHLAAVCGLDAPGGVGENQTEVLVGPGGSTFNPALIIEREPPEQFDYYFGEWNYTRFTADPGEGTINVQYVRDDGELVAEIVLQL